MLAPQPPVIADCTIIAVDGLAPYLFCENSDGSGEEWRVPVVNASKYKCTTPEGFVAGKTYAKELTSWINTNCNGKEAPRWLLH